jgi:hypothetical protein
MDSYIKARIDRLEQTVANQMINLASARNEIGRLKQMLGYVRNAPFSTSAPGDAQWCTPPGGGIAAYGGSGAYPSATCTFDDGSTAPVQNGFVNSVVGSGGHRLLVIKDAAGNWKNASEDCP